MEVRQNDARCRMGKTMRTILFWISWTAHCSIGSGHAGAERLAETEVSWSPMAAVVLKARIRKRKERRHERRDSSMLSTRKNRDSQSPHLLTSLRWLTVPWM